MSSNKYGSLIIANNETNFYKTFKKEELVFLNWLDRLNWAPSDSFGRRFWILD